MKLELYIDPPAGRFVCVWNNQAHVAKSTCKSTQKSGSWKPQSQQFGAARVLGSGVQALRGSG